MKKVIRLTFLLVFIFLNSSVFAQRIAEMSKTKPYAIGFRYSFADADDADYTKHGNNYSLNFMRSLSNALALELESGYVQYKSKHGTRLGVFSNYLNLQLRKPIDDWTPYIVAGLGAQAFHYSELRESDKKDKVAGFSYKTGIGLEYALDMNWSLNFEASYIYGNTGGSATLDTYGWLYGGGIRYYF